MSLTVRVERDAGDVPGPDIVCSYFASESVFREVGRVAIDAAARGLKIVSVTLPGMRAHVRPGQIIQIDDEGCEYRAEVTSIAYSVGRQADGTPFATCTLGLRMLEVR